MVKQTNGVHDATFSIETQSNKRLLLQPADMCFESDRLEAGPSTTTIPSLMSTLCPFDDLSTEERMTHAASGLPWKVRGRLVQISPLSMSSQMTATGSFGVAFNSDQRDFHAFNTLFNHFYSQRDAKPLANAQVGSYCAFYASQSWLRGVIVRVSVQHCLVAAIDTGLELCLNHDKLFHLASNFSELPFALRCVYPRCEFLSDIGAPQLSAFKVGNCVTVTVISAYEPCLAILEKDDGPTNEHLLIDKSRLAPDALLAWDDMLHSSMKGLPAFAFASGPEPTGDDFNPMVVCRFVSPDEFYVRDIGQTLRVAAIRESMRDSYKDTQESDTQEMDLTFPNLRVLTAGLACAVYNDEHLIWTRSVVKKVSKTETDDDEILEALSVDYGWLMSVPIVSEPIQFAMLPHNLANFPTQLHRVAVNRSTVSSFERRHRYKKEDEIMRELLPVGTVVMIKGVAPRKKGADLTYSVPVLMKLPQPAQLTAHRDETIWQTVERMYDELECIEKARRAGSQASSEADWSPNGPPDFGRDRLRSSTPDSVLSSPVRQNNHQEKGRHHSPLQQQNNLHQQQDDSYLQHNGPYQLQNVSHQQRNRSPGVPIVRKQAKKQPQELSRVHDRRSGGRARSPSPSPTKRQQPVMGRGRAVAQGAAATHRWRQPPAPASRMLGFGRGIKPDSPDGRSFLPPASPAIRRTFSSSLGAGGFRQLRSRQSLASSDRPPSQEDDVELAFLDRTSTSVFSTVSDEGVNFSKTCRLQAPESGMTPRVAIALRSHTTSCASTPANATTSSTSSSHADELPYERRQRVQIVTVRSASEIFLHTAATKRDALAKHAELQDVYLKEEAPPIVWTTHVGELYVSNVKGAYCRVKLLRRTNDAVVVELIDTGAVRDLPVNSEFRVLLPTLRYKPTCIGPCRLAGEFPVEEWLSLAATNLISSLIDNAGNIEAELRPKGSRYEVILWDLSTTTINEQFAESFAVDD